MSKIGQYLINLGYEYLKDNDLKDNDLKDTEDNWEKAMNEITGGNTNEISD